MGILSRRSAQPGQPGYDADLLLGTFDSLRAQLAQALGRRTELVAQAQRVAARMDNDLEKLLYSVMMGTNVGEGNTFEIAKRLVGDARDLDKASKIAKLAAQEIVLGIGAMVYCCPPQQVVMAQILGVHHGLSKLGIDQGDDAALQQLAQRLESARSGWLPAIPAAIGLMWLREMQNVGGGQAISDKFKPHSEQEMLQLCLEGSCCMGSMATLLAAQEGQPAASMVAKIASAATL